MKIIPATPPFKLALAALLLDGPPRSSEEILALLQPLFGREKICTLSRVERSLMNLKALGIVDMILSGGTEKETQSLRWGLGKRGRERVLRAL